MLTRSKNESPRDKKCMRGVAIKCMNAPKKKPPLQRLSGAADERLPGVAHILGWAQEYARRDRRAELDRINARPDVLGFVRLKQLFSTTQLMGTFKHMS